ncbi:MAG: YceI family protein [Planctomycetes bacterium]|nr:YceI family protein [Planctomycetota bacterium]
MKLLPILLVGALAAPLFLSASKAEPVTLPVAGATYEIDGVHSSVLFRIKHLGVSYFYGRFNEVTGSFVYDEAKPETSSIQVEVATASVDTGHDGRDQHLQSPDFFNAAEHPKLTFKSKEVKKSKDGKLSVTGDLTLHGVTKPVTADVEFVGAGDRGQMGNKAGFETTFTIKREDFGMTKMLGETGLGNDVRVTVSLEGNLKQ